MYALKLEELDRLLNDPKHQWKQHAFGTCSRRCPRRTDPERGPGLRLELTLGAYGRRSAAIRNSQLPSGPFIGLSVMPNTAQPGCPAHHSRIWRQTEMVHGRIPDDAPVPNESRSRLELRLDERDGPGIGTAKRDRSRKQCSQTNEASVAHQRVDRLGTIARVR